VINPSNYANILLGKLVSGLYDSDSLLRMTRATVLRAVALFAALSLIKADEYPFEVLIRSGMPEDAAFPFGAVVNQVGMHAIFVQDMS